MEHRFTPIEKDTFLLEEEEKAFYRKLKVYEYLLVLSPHEHLRDKVMLEKQEFAKKYETGFANYLKPHIIISMFAQYEMLEQRIDARFRTIAMGLPSFKIDLENFGSLPTHTIYINVKTQEPVKAIAKRVKSAQKLMALDKNSKPYFTNEPHLPIARKLLPWQYEKAWSEYQHKYFSGSFIADKMVLMKRLVGDRSYQIVNQYEFRNLDIEGKQGDLFG